MFIDKDYNLWRVSINSISHSSLKLFIISEYKTGELVVPDGTERNVYFWCLVQRKIFFSIEMANWNLMIYLSYIQADNPYFIWSGADVAYNITTAWNRELSMFVNTNNVYIRDTHYPDEIINVLNMFLMRFWG